MTLFSSQIFGGLELSPEWRAQTSTWKNALKPYIEDIPEILGEFLDDKLDLMTLIKVKTEFYLHLLDGGFLDELPPSVADLTQAKLSECVETMEELLLDLEKAPVLEDTDLLEGSCIGIGRTALQLHRQGKLTLSYVLKIQPWIIIPFEEK